MTTHSARSNDLHVVLGAGPAGSAVTRELADRGLPVRLVARSTISQPDPRVDIMRADVSTPEGAIAATKGATVIYHAVNVAYHLQVGVMPDIATSVIAAAETHGAKLVVLDTLYPYGEADGEHITEQSAWAATSRKGRMRAELDRRYLAAHADGRIRTALGRSADFFGPHVLTSTLGGAFFPGALTGSAALAFGDTSLPHSYTFVRDVARGLATLGTSDDGDGRIWHLPTVPAVPTTEIHAIVEELTGIPLVVTTLEAPEPFGPFDKQVMDEYAEIFYQHLIPQNMVSRAFEDTFAIHPTPLREALQATITWYRSHLQTAAPA